MEPTTKYYKEQFYIKTKSQNKISKSIILKGLENIKMHGKDVMHSQVFIRGDMAPIILGEYVIIKENVIIRPSFTKEKGKLKYIMMEIGNCVTIEASCVIQAAKIGNNVHIGKNCIVGRNVAISDNCKILDDSVVPPDTVIPPYSVFGGKPVQFMGELTESIAMINEDLAKTYFKNFQELKQQPGDSS